LRFLIRLCPGSDKMTAADCKRNMQCSLEPDQNPNEVCQQGKLDCYSPICKPRTAGRIFDKSGTVKECLQYEKGVPDFNNRNITPDYVPKDICHGNSTLVSYPVGLLVNPKRKTNFQIYLQDKKEAFYASKKMQLGNIREPTAYKGSNYVPDNTKLYGDPTVYDDPAGLLINPPKNYQDVMKEMIGGHEKYVKTHNDYFPGEMVKRDYDWGDTNPRTFRFGKETPHYNNGKNMAQCLKWVYRKSPIRHTYLVSKNFDDYQDKFQPLLAKVFDPKADSLKVHPDHTFGVVTLPDEAGAGDLIHMRSKDFLAGSEPKRGWLACLRHHLKQANYHNFDGLKSAFKFYDPEETGFIEAENLRRACWSLNLPIDNKLLSRLMLYCSGKKKEGFDFKKCKINYERFVNFLNWDQKYNSLLPSFPSPYQKVKPKEKIERIVTQLDPALTNHFTTSSLYGEGLDRLPEIEKKRASGVPTIRNDLPAPRLRCIADQANYGDESDVHGLVSPTLCSLYGVYDRDFFELRSRDEILSIFKGAGVKMSNEVFDKTWELALEWCERNLTRREPNKVSIDAFRSVLDLAQADSLRKGEAMEMSMDFHNYSRAPKKDSYRR